MDNPEYVKSLEKALDELRNAKPNDRSERDRRFAIAITDMEKLIAFIKFYL